MTAPLWLPGAERVPGPHAAGGQMAGGNCLLTHHITVSPVTAYALTRDYLVKEGFEPTLILDPWHDHRGQFLPADRSAFALKHPPGQPETNREGTIHIQVEWLCPNMQTDLTKAPHFAEQWHDLCVWAKAFGVPYLWTFGGPLSTSRDPVTYKKPGHRGHRNAPGNDHVDSITVPTLAFPPVTPIKTTAVHTTEKPAVKAPATPARYHVVVAGDTLATIAKAVGRTVAQIEAMNPGIQSKPLVAGERVKTRTGTN